MAEEQVESPVSAPKSAKKMTQYALAGRKVMDAILNLNERKGSSIPKIRNYISANNPDLDMSRYGKLIKKFVLSAVEKGELKVNDETKGVRGYFKIPAQDKKKVKKTLEKSASDEKSVSKEKTSKNASSPKVKKPVSKTVKLPSAVAASTIKKKNKPRAKASPVEAEKEPAAKSKKKASATKSTKKDEAPAPKKSAKKGKEVEKPKEKAKPKKNAKSAESDDAGTHEETVQKVAKGKKKKAEADKTEKVAAKKKKTAKVDDENKE